jgi:hypothetical protein
MEIEELTATPGKPVLTGRRRDFLIGGILALGGAAAGALAYRELVPPEKRRAREFVHHGNSIIEKHYQQSTATVAALKAKYETAVFGKARVWDLIEKLALCIDETDSSLYCTSQLIHVQQVLEGIECDAFRITTCSSPH